MKIVEDGIEVYLEKKDSDISGSYDIKLIDTDDVIGYIEYDPYFDISNITYYIDKNYRGKKYSYQSLVLLSNYLKNNSINEFSLLINKKNKPSLGVADRFIVNNSVDTDIKMAGKNNMCYSYKIKI